MIVCDTGPLVAAAITDDAHHRVCVDLFASLHLAGRRILLARDGGARVEAQILSSLADGSLSPVDLTPEDYQRAATLVLEYASLPLGTTDATVIAPAERLGLAEVATLDRRHPPGGV